MFLPPKRPLWSQYLSEVCLLWHPIVYSSLSRSTIPWNCFGCLSLILFEGQDSVLFTPVSSGRTPKLAASLHSPSTISPAWGWVLRATLCSLFPRATAATLSLFLDIQLESQHCCIPNYPPLYSDHPVLTICLYLQFLGLENGKFSWIPHPPSHQTMPWL